jgi:hypothetical protein
MIVVEAGDKDIRHNVSRTNTRIGSLPVTTLDATDFIDEFRLAPWIKWMEKVDFDSMWGKNV